MTQVIRRGVLAAGVVVLAVGMVAGVGGRVLALIEGGEGNAPITDPGWPMGAAGIFNHTGRVAYWVGPPFGGGQWTGEYRGDAAAFNAVLVEFAKLDVKSKRLVVHDGAGTSFWLNTFRDPKKAEVARMDWTFSVWQRDRWEFQLTLPAGRSAVNAADAEMGPPVRIEVYAGGDLRWADVKIPKGITVDDQRLEAHGFTAADGVVLEGNVVDLETKKPIAGKMRLECVNTPAKGGYVYLEMAKVEVDAKGRWVMKNSTGLWNRIVIEADGYAPRVVGHVRHEGQPRWHQFDTSLTRMAKVSGRVADEAGAGLGDVEVAFDDVVSGGQRYESPERAPVKTSADGKFETMVPQGTTLVWLTKSGYVRPGLGLKVTTPAKDLTFTMKKSATLKVTVDFGGEKRTTDYIVEMTPEGGNVVGSWGGSANIDQKNQHVFEGVPPGKYTFVGHPNPSSEKERTEPVTVELKGGESTELKIVAKVIPVQPKLERPEKAKPVTKDAF